MSTGESQKHKREKKKGVNKAKKRLAERIEVWDKMSQKQGYNKPGSLQKGKCK